MEFHPQRTRMEEEKAWIAIRSFVPHSLTVPTTLSRADRVRPYIHPLSQLNGILLSPVAGAAMNATTN